MSISVTIPILTTAKFDGAVCSEECEHFKILSSVGMMRCFGYACLQFRTENIGMHNMRNDKCIEMFGMGEEG